MLGILDMATSFSASEAHSASTYLYFFSEVILVQIDSIDSNRFKKDSKKIQIDTKRFKKIQKDSKRFKLALLDWKDF